MFSLAFKKHNCHANGFVLLSNMAEDLTMHVHNSTCPAVWPVFYTPNYMYKLYYQTRSTFTPC